MIFVAFSMYSIIPTPHVEWDNKTMKHAMSFLPFIGVVISALIFLWNIISMRLQISNFLYSSIMIIIPIFISGAIHMDGFIDTSDAIFSRQNTERKLEILKDSNIGAFGLILALFYITIMFGLWGQIYEFSKKNLASICISYILSRTLGARAIVSFKTAKNTGLAYIFSDLSHKESVKMCTTIYTIILFIILVFLNTKLGIFLTIGTIFYFLFFKRICYKGFGGITGDLAGFFIQTYEVFFLGVVVIYGILQ